MSLTQEQVQQAYADTINILFGGAVRAEPEQINEQVILHVDMMVSEIANCSKNMTELSFNLIFNALLLVGSGKIATAAANLFGVYADNFLVRFMLEYEPTGIAYQPVSELLHQWVQALMRNRLHKACILTARANWRSKIEIELLGL